MAAKALTLGTKPCPFCNFHFKRVGNHLPRCRERNGRDYIQHLAPKSIAKREKKRVKKVQCSKCSRFFVRLDTHLRNSATCRVIPSPPPPCVLSPANATATLVPAIFSSAQNSNTGSCTSEMSKDNNEPLTTTSPAPQMKGTLLLPTSPEGWEEADHHFAAALVPSLLLSPNPQEINSLLVLGIYSYFSTVCGSKRVRAVKVKKRPLRNATLKDVMRKKK